MQRTWTKSAAVLFMAAVSVYADPATPVIPAIPAIPSIPATLAPSSDASTPAAPAADVHVVATPAAPAEPTLSATPASPTPDAAPATVAADEPTTQPVAIEQVPAPEGKSITKSEVSVSDAGTVEIHVNEANLVEVLRMLSIQSQRNIIASKEVQGVITANLYDVTVREALDAILKANGYGYQEKGNFIYVYTAKEIAEMEKADRKMTSEVFRLFYTPAANAQNMLKPVLSADGQVAFTQAAASGIAAGTSDVGGNSHSDEDCIVVTDYPENLDRARALLKEIDRRPQQILIEATILRAALTNDNTLGVDFNFLGGVNFATVQHNNGQIINGQLPQGDNSFPNGTSTSTGTGNTFTGGTNGFRVGVLNNNLSLFLTALETNTNTSVMANPKILALNKQRGEVIVGRKDGYYTTTVTENATVQTVEFLETGTRLVFRPYVGDDGFVRMEVHPEDSSGGLNAANLPFKVTTEVTSNVLVKDGHTVVIGGLFREVSTSTTNQVPFLGSLPLAGYLFRKQNDNTNREEVIILLTPHIIKDQGPYADASAKALKDAEKHRVGVRKGMMPFSRTRLAEISYDQARAEMDKPDANRGKAMFYLNVATGLDPMFPEALSLKESITGEELTGVSHSITRDFVRTQILADRAAGITVRPSVYSVPIRSERDKNGNNGTSASAVTPAAAPATTHESSVATKAIEQALAESSPAATTQPAPGAVAAADPTTQPALAVTQETPATPETVVTVVEDAPAIPTTQPAAPETTVTELPTQEINPE